MGKGLGRGGTRSRLLIVALTATFLVQGLPTLPVQLAVAQEAPPEETEEAPLTPETIIEVALPTEEDRDLEQVPIDLNTILDPEETVPSFGTGGTPDQLTQGEVLQEQEGSEYVDVFAESPAAGTHLAIVYPEVVNEEVGGEWVDIPLEPVPSDYGWTMSGLEHTVQFPALLSPEAPIRYQIPQGELAFVPEGVQDAQGITEGSSVRYEGALAQTDFVYNPAPGGYKEEVVLWTPEAGLTVTWNVTATNLWLQDPGNGTLEVHSSEGLVGTLGTPVVYDSSEQPQIFTARYQIEDLGSGSWRLVLSIPQTWADAATYPLTIDPGTTDASPLGDTYANSASGKRNTNYSSASELEVGPSYRTFIKFGQSWQTNNLIVYSANMKLYNTYQADPSANVDVQRITSGWNETQVTWNSQPAATSGNLISGKTGSSNAWWSFGLGGLYQDIINGTFSDYGVRITGGRKTFASSSHSDTTKRPYLAVSYNNLPHKPQVTFPETDPKVFTTLTPTIKIAQIPGDPDGDEVLVNYQVTDVQGDWSGANMEQSGWTDEESFTIPAGWLEDGVQYWFRVQSRDICNPPLGFCDNEDANNQVHEPLASTVQSFSVALDHFGTDPNWAMWTQPLGNSMTLSVNESNGNVYLSVPIDSLPTPLGNLRIGLSYNSLKDAEGTDTGIGPGWDLHVGGAARTGKLPLRIEELTPSPWAGVEVTYRSGKTEQFPYRGGRTYAPIGAATGTVVKNLQGGFTLTAPDGDQFTFDADGKLKTSRPVSTKPSAEAAANPYYDYTYNASGRLSEVTDPLGRKVTFDWVSGELQGIHTWVAGGDWALTYQGGTLRTITTPESEVLTFMEDQVCTGGTPEDLLTQVRDGDQVSNPGWRLEYAYDSGGGSNFPICRATKAYPPQPAGGTQHWYFNYGTAGHRAYTSLGTFITDPRGTATETPPNDYRTEVQFNWAGLPIQIQAPKKNPGQESDWVTTMHWNSHNQMVCSASPAANAARIAAGGTTACSSSNTTDPLATKRFYETDEPYRLTQVLHPAPDVATPSKRIQETLEYDDGDSFVGLWATYYENKNLSGVPDEQGLYTDMNKDWGTGSPTPIAPTDYWSIRLTGSLDITAGSEIKKEFRVTSDDGVALVVGQKVLLDCIGEPFSGVNCGLNNPPRVLLKPGLRPITIEYQDLTGSANLKVEWRTVDTPQPDWEVIPSSKLKPNLGLLTARTAGPEGAVGGELTLETRYGYPNDLDKMLRLPQWKKVTDLDTQEVFRTDYFYDDYGRRTKTIRFANKSTPQEIQRVFTDDAQADTSCMTRLKREMTTGQFAVTDYECNKAGDVIKVTQKISEVMADQGQTVLQPAQDRVTQMTYDRMGRLTTEDLPGEAKRRYTYDDAGRLIESKVLVNFAANEWAITTFEYFDHAPQPWMKETLPDPDGPGPLAAATIEHTYDRVGNEIDTTRPGQPGAHFTYTYDAQNRIVESRSPTQTGGLTTTTQYLLVPYEVRTTDPSGHTSISGMDLLGRASYETLAQGSSGQVTYSYDDAGNLIREVTTGYDATQAGWVEHDYDSFGRVLQTRTKHVVPGQDETVTTTYAYDSLGRLVQVNGPMPDNGQHKDVIEYDYDLAGRITRTRMYTTGGATPEYSDTDVVYNDASEQLRITTQLDGSTNQKRDFSYNSSGLLEQAKVYHGASSLGTLVTSFSYNAAGWLTTKDVPGTSELRFDYDLSGREIKRWAFDGVSSDQIYTAYDASGNVTSVSTQGGSSTITATYDELERIEQVLAQEAWGYIQTDYGYSQSTGLPESLQVSKIANQQTTTLENLSYEYWSGGGHRTGLLKKVTDALSNRSANYDYDSLLRPVSRTDKQGTNAILTFTRTYEPKTGLVNTQEVKTGDGGAGTGTLAYIDLDYDEAGNVITRMQRLWRNAPYTGQDPGGGGTGYSGGTGTWTYAYDGAGRMVSASGPSPDDDGPGFEDQSFTYSYDGAGNRTQERVTADGQNSDYVFSLDSQGLPLSVDGPGSAEDFTFTHSNKGFLTEVTPTGQQSPIQRFDYDPWGRLTSGSGGGVTATYALDALGRTVRRTPGSSDPVYFSYEGMTETLVSEASTTETLWSNLPSGPWLQKQGSEQKTAIRDLHGDLIGLSASDGSNIQGAFWYSPFGESAEIEPSAPSLGYQGQLTDPQTGLVDMTTRQYMPSLGRFTTPDALFGEVSDPQSLNLWAYAGANPVTRSDPSGMSWMVHATGGRTQKDTTDYGDDVSEGSDSGAGSVEDLADGFDVYSELSMLQMIKLRQLWGPAVSWEHIDAAVEAAMEFNVDPYLVIALMLWEGSGRARIGSAFLPFEALQGTLQEAMTGKEPSIGIMQMQFPVFVETVRRHGRKLGLNPYYVDRATYVTALQDDATAIRVAAAYLSDVAREVESEHRNDPGVLAAIYNGGSRAYASYLSTGHFGGAQRYYVEFTRPGGVYDQAYLLL